MVLLVFFFPFYAAAIVEMRKEGKKYSVNKDTQIRWVLNWIEKQRKYSKLI